MKHSVQLYVCMYTTLLVTYILYLKSTTAEYMITEIVRKNPHALGLVLLVCNQDVPKEVEGLNPLYGIENGARALNDALNSLGLAVVHLEKPSATFLMAVIEALSSFTDYPRSYSCFFSYITGHGANRVFYTHDGAVSYSNVVEPFKKTSFAHKIYFFDCCRSVRLEGISLYDNDGQLHPHPITDLAKENLIIYSTASGTKAYAKHGVGVVTDKFTRLLLTMKKSLQDIIQQLRRELPEGIELPSSHDRTSKPIYWYEDRAKASELHGTFSALRYLLRLINIPYGTCICVV